jgi:hypothetical protein
MFCFGEKGASLILKSVKTRLFTAQSACPQYSAKLNPIRVSQNPLRLLILTPIKCDLNVDTLEVFFFALCFSGIFLGVLDHLILFLTMHR